MILIVDHPMHILDALNYHENYAFVRQVEVCVMMQKRTSASNVPTCWLCLRFYCIRTTNYKIVRLNKRPTKYAYTSKFVLNRKCYKVVVYAMRSNE